MSVQTLRGYLNNPEIKVAIILAEFNDFITNALLNGALETLKYTGNVNEDNILVVRVPGAYEIPYTAKQLALTGKYDAIITLGAVIRGATPHFDYVCGPMSSQIMNISLETNTPISFGVLTTNSIEEAIERCGTKAGNKGIDAANVALQMYNLKTQIK
ncbi:6,7-dimethyl-8-ribityllumazine synthase [Psittacicella gerlachiana]|uniref:6,7-dimethyl-8-ribityllumazine synthase n=1 Tax=Psittacicella gerlachiana TaxID=2028574 RepID=A0A3A1Y9D6_9GAMM|nr:6,7-dimethyl-8-ribityllumazine synthase [Psittacicella gerlachiana]RIY33808.1 6,7-dimethyl-8-ribityllumazine synthase [Psittacicella gerlachiana]